MKLRYNVWPVMAVCLLASTTSLAADYIIDKKGQHASITFKASHLGYSYIIGRFNDFEGTFSHDATHPENSKASVTISAKSIDTNHAERDKHMRSPNFLDVAKHPTVRFDSSAYTNDAGVGLLKGNLTLHGVTKVISIRVNHIGEGDDPWGGYRSGFEGKTLLTASDFGMPDWVGDIEVMLNVEGVRQ
ncbi:MAG: hypothetical protein HOC23_19485 [Halieaceae bacterium]|jgi:polyisoprenoid-binding protein YceI|nr:hypothetical protein [Halieaceae bacterium]